MKTLRTDEGREALDWLREERGLSDEIINQFQVGFVPSRVQHEFAGRIITPICDPYGNPVAISSRHIKNKRSFLHESFEKKFYLYGLNIAKYAMLRQNKAILVEGEIDVMYLHTHGFRMTVGVCGSAFTLLQASLLARYCSRVYIVFDRDKNNAGQKSMRRIMDMINEGKIYGVKYIPVSLPMGYDPDDFLKQNSKEDFIELLKDSERNLAA